MIPRRQLFFCIIKSFSMQHNLCQSRLQNIFTFHQAFPTLLILNNLTHKSYMILGKTLVKSYLFRSAQFNLHLLCTVKTNHKILVQHLYYLLFIIISHIVNLWRKISDILSNQSKVNIEHKNGKLFKVRTELLVSYNIRIQLTVQNPLNHLSHDLLF